jgi:hypothetical protein
MRGVFDAEQAPEDSCELCAVGRRRPKKVHGTAVVLAAVHAAEADAADGIGCGDPGKNGYACGDVEVLAPPALLKHIPGYFQVCPRRPEPGPRFGA